MIWTSDQLPWGARAALIPKELNLTIPLVIGGSERHGLDFKSRFGFSQKI